jgi:hypothetical protein
MVELVPGRECGTCNACCVFPLIDSPELTKLSGSVCRHSNAAGCDIYESRPGVCRRFFCGWRRNALIPEDWRPDRSGIFVTMGTENVPPQFGGAAGFTLMLVGNPLKTVRQPGFLDFVATFVSRRIPVFLAVPGPRGSHAASLLLNEPQMEAAVRQTRTAVKTLLEQALKRFAGHDYPPYVMEHGGVDVSS